jgi:plastocyanin
MKIAKALVGVMLTAGMFTLAGCAASGAQTSGGPASTTHASSSSSSASSSPPGTSTGAATATIAIKSFAYEVPKSVEPGAKITVTDADSTSHTVTSDSGNAFDAAVPGGGSATFTAPMKPGSYPFHCKYHANMHGVLVVKSTT